MAAPSETPSPPEGDEGNNGVEVCLFDESRDEFSRAVRAMSELAASEPEPAFPDTEVKRLASSMTFLREWRHFSYEPKGVSFTCSTGSASSGHDTHEITLPQFSSASFPKVTQLEDERGNNTDSRDFVLFAGGNVWSLDWCPRLCDKPCSLVNCEYLAVSAHPPGSSYHKLGMPLIGRGIIQVWCVVVPFEEVQPLAYNKNRRGRPKKIPDGNICSSNPPKSIGRPRKMKSTGSDDHIEPSLKRPWGRPRKYPLSVAKVVHPLAYNKNRRGRPKNIPDRNICSSNPPKPIGRPRKMKSTGSDDHIEPSLKRPRGRPRKYPLSVAKVVDLSENSGSQDPSFIEPLVTSTVIPGDLALARVMPAVQSNPRKGRGRPRKIPVDKTKCLSDIELKENMSMALISMKPKKKRGRPRKCPAPSSSKHVMGIDTELERATACLPVSVGCNLGHTGYAESNSNLSDVKVDATLPILSSSSAICDKKSRGRRGGQPKNDTISGALSCSVVSGFESLSMGSRDTISNDTTISVDNSLPAGHSILGSMTSELCSEDSLLPMHIAPKSNGEEPSGRMGKGWPRKKPLPSTTSCVLASGTESTMTIKTGSVITSSDNPMALAKSDGEVLASDLDSVGSLRCNIEKCNVHLSAVSYDSRSPAHSFCIANCKEKSSAKRGKGRHAKNPASTECSCCTTFSSDVQDIQTTPNPTGNRASVENCKKELLVYTRRGARQPKRKFASNESCSLALSGEVQNMERSSTPNNQLSSLENSREAGLIGSKTGVGCEVMEMNDGNAAYQIVPVSVQNSSQVIDDVEDTEVALFKESIKNDNTCAENSNFSPIPKGIHLPRIVLCLAHNGKVAWDIKWKPPLPNQSEQKTRLGFLAILLGNGSLEVWEVPSPSMIQKIYSSSSIEGTDPRFLKLQPVFRCAKVKCGSRQSIPLTVDWSPSPHDMILAGCHDGTVALWKFSTDLPSQDSKPFMCVTAESVPIRALSWAPYVSEEMANTFVTAGEDGLKFWDLRDPYRPLWELTTAPRAVLSLHWLKDARGIVISLEDGTLKFLSLPRIANDAPVTGRPFTGTKTQGVSTYQLSEYLIWNVHVSEITGYAAYCVADGTAVRFHLTSRFWEREPGKNRVPYYLCGSLAEEGTVIKIGGMSPSSPLSNVPLVPKKGPKSFQDVDQAHRYVNLELREGQLDGPDEGQETNALVLADRAMQENVGICNGSAGGSLKDFMIFPPKAVALHRLRWNMNKGSERWLCYGGTAGIIRCQRI